VHKHVVRDRLHALSNGNTRLTEPELDHLEGCSMCQAVCAKFIIEAVRVMAKDRLISLN